MAEGLAGYYRVMEHSVHPQMDESVKSAKLEEPLRQTAEAVMLAEEKDRSSATNEQTPSGSEPNVSAPAVDKPGGKGTADRAAARRQGSTSGA